MEHIGESWRKASYSGSNGQGCVEVADAPRVVLVRDSKNRDSGTLAFTAEAWRRFVAEQRLALGRSSND